MAKNFVKKETIERLEKFINEEGLKTLEEVRDCKGFASRLQFWSKYEKSNMDTIVEGVLAGLSYDEIQLQCKGKGSTQPTTPEEEVEQVIDSMLMISDQKVVDISEPVEVTVGSEESKSSKDEDEDLIKTIVEEIIGNPGLIKKMLDLVATKSPNDSEEDDETSVKKLRGIFTDTDEEDDEEDEDDSDTDEDEDDSDTDEDEDDSDTDEDEDDSETSKKKSKKKKSDDPEVKSTPAGTPTSSKLRRKWDHSFLGCAFNMHRAKF